MSYAKDVETGKKTYWKRTEERILKLLDTYEADVPPLPLKEAP